MIDVSRAHLGTIRSILSEHVPDCQVRVFGSRRTRRAKPYSDLDLAVVGAEKLDYRKVAALKRAFQASDLPFRVDVLDWNAISASFRATLEEQGYETWQISLGGERMAPVYDVLLTADAGLLALHPKEGVAVLTPAEFLEGLEG
jgi:type I restriction enzyme S subunit